VGNIDVNCIVVDGTPYPLEFTMRFGWPGFNIEMALHKGDPVEWLYDLWDGRDTLRVRDGCAVGVVMAHGDFPHCKWPPEKDAGFPINGITREMEKHVWPQWVMMGSTPTMSGKEQPALVTAGPIPFTVTGTGMTVDEARTAAYDRAWSIDWPSNRMFRTDIGKRLKEQLPKLHSHGFAKGLNYD